MMRRLKLSSEPSSYISFCSPSTFYQESENRPETSTMADTTLLMPHTTLPKQRRPSREMPTKRDVVLPFNPNIVIENAYYAGEMPDSSEGSDQPDGGLTRRISSRRASSHGAPPLRVSPQQIPPQEMNAFTQAPLRGSDRTSAHNPSIIMNHPRQLGGTGNYHRLPRVTSHIKDQNVRDFYYHRVSDFADIPQPRPRPAARKGPDPNTNELGRRRRPWEQTSKYGSQVNFESSPHINVSTYNNSRVDDGVEQQDSPPSPPSSPGPRQNEGQLASHEQTYALPPSTHPYVIYKNQVRHYSSDLSARSSSSESEDEGEQENMLEENTSGAVTIGHLVSHLDHQEYSTNGGGAEVDEDLLDPLKWTKRVSSIESILRQNYENRKSWPLAWHHSDSKNWPKALDEGWKDFMAVDHQITQLGLNDVFPLQNTRRFQSKQKGSLSEVMNAFIRTRPSSGTIPTPRRGQSCSNNISGSFENWASTSHEILRLLKARDYLIMICRDAEFLNSLHPSMGAITWFQRVGTAGESRQEASYPLVIELMSVSLTKLGAVILSLNLILQALIWGFGDDSSVCFHVNTENNEIPSRVIVKPGSLHHKLQPNIVASTSDDNGAKSIEAYLNTLDLGLSLLNTELEVFSAILNQALLFQCNVHISSPDSSPTISVTYGVSLVLGLVWDQYPLECVGALIQHRPVWVLVQHGDVAPVESSPAGEGSVITSLARTSSLGRPLISLVRQVLTSLGTYLKLTLEPRLRI